MLEHARAEDHLTGQSVLRVSCLGTFGVVRPGESQTIGVGSGHKSWLLLKYLAAHKGTPVPTQRIMDIFWPERRFPEDTSALRTAVSRLESMLEPRRTAYCKHPYIIYRKDACAFNINTPCWLDIEEFERSCAMAHRLGRGDRAGAVDLYGDALDLYRGDFLAEDLYLDWTVLPREYYRRLFLDACKEAASWLIEMGDYMRACMLLERAIQADPLVEEFHILLMRALIGLGKNRAAREHYTYCSGLLYRELGVRPADELKQLYQQVKAHEGDARRGVAVYAS